MKNKLKKEVILLLKILRKDAKMALNDKWDRGDGGFECQIILINEMLDKLKSKDYDKGNK